MAEGDIRKRFLSERKRTILGDIEKVQTEYDAIVIYLNVLLSEARLKSDVLLNESDYVTFNQRFGSSMNTIQDILSKFILIRLSLPDQNDCNDAREEEAIDIEKTNSAFVSYVPPNPTPLPDESYPEGMVGGKRTAMPLSSSFNRSNAKPPINTQAHRGEDLQQIHGPENVKTDADQKSSKNFVLNDCNIKPRCVKVEDVPQLTKLALCDQIVSVSVIEVHTPWLIWVQMRTKDQQLREISDILEVHHMRYSCKDPKYQLDVSLIRVGSLVSAQYSDEIWYRARIVTVFNSLAPRGNLVTEVEVLYIDYGNRLRVPLNWLRSLPSDLLEWPAQAFVCAIASVAPVNNSDWSSSVIEDFSRTIMDSKQCIRITKRNPASSHGCPLVFVDILKDDMATRSASSSGAAHLLVNHGLARPIKDCQTVLDWYLKNFDSMISSTDDIVEGMRWIDLHRLQMPELFLDDTCADDSSSVASSSCRNFSAHLASIEVRPDAAISSCLQYSLPTTTSILYNCKQEAGLQTLKTNFSKHGLSDGIKQLDEMIACPKIRGYEEKSRSRVGNSAAAARDGRNVDGVTVVGHDLYGQLDMQEAKMLATKSWVESSLAQIQDNDFPSQDSSSNFLNLSPTFQDRRGRTKKHDQKNVMGSEVPATEIKKSISPADKIRIVGSALAEGHTTSKDSCDERIPVRDKSAVEAGVENKKSAADPKEETTKSSLKAEDRGSTSNRRRTKTKNNKQTDLKVTDPVTVPPPPAADYVEKPSICEMDESQRQAPDNSRPINVKFPPVKLTVPADHRFAVAMSVIESPGRFWVHAVNNEVEQIDLLSVKLAQYAERAKVFGDEPVVLIEIYAVCCVRSRSDGLLYRAEIIRICHGDVGCSLTVESGVDVSSCTCDHFRVRSADEATSIRAVCVLFVDYGNTEWKDPSDLLPAPANLLDIPQKAICCQLEAVEPLANNNDIFQENKWSKEAADYFTSLVGYDKLLWAFVGTDLNTGTVVIPSMRKPLRVTVMDLAVSISRSINEQLVDEGFAKKIDGLPLKSWNPMNEDYFSERNSYLVDVDDPGVATVGYKANDESRICRFFNMRGGCWKGANCPMEHTRYSDIKTVTNDKKPVYWFNDFDFMTELPEPGGWTLVQVVHIFSPNHVCVVFPYGTQSYSELLECGAQKAEVHATELSKFHEELHKHYSRKTFPNSDLTLLASGELVVAKYGGNDRWYRARVIGRDSDHNIQVLYVDYGNNEWITHDRIRQMEPQFLHLPSQAVHCFLPICSTMPGGKWDVTAREVFEELVVGKILAAKILSSGHEADSLRVELYDGDDFNICEELINMELARPAANMISVCLSTSRLIPG